MNPAIHSLYRENQILSAAPLELIGLMLGTASREIAKGTDFLSRGDAVKHAESIGKASRIICELTLALDHENGQTMSANLWRLYDYIQSILTDAKLCRETQKLRTVTELTGTLADSFLQASSYLQRGERGHVDSQF